MSRFAGSWPRRGRPDDYVELVADSDAGYDVTDEIDLSTLEPLIATPRSPGNVVPVRKVAGQDVHQVVVGSSANPGLRDFAILAAIMPGRQARPRYPWTSTRPRGRSLPT